MQIEVVIVLKVIANIMLMVAIIAVVILLLVSVWRHDFKRGACDYDCEQCPFPKCSDKQIERWKEYDLHHR